MAFEDVERGLLPRLARVVEVTLKDKTKADQPTMKNALIAVQAWLEAHQLEGDVKSVPLDRAVHWIEQCETKLGIERR
jgi:hypothetical protein